jgi:hypothetical protein
MGFALGGSFVSQGASMNNLVNLTPASIASAISIFSLPFHGLLAVLIWCGCLRNRFSEKSFRYSRMVLALLAVSYAVWCGWRLIPMVPLPEHWEQLGLEFRRELIAYSIFWVLVPPIWFFVEYLAVESECIRGYNNLKSIKDYADYASKVWAAVLALLVAVIAFKR